jgi:hypothetical protein
MKDHEEEDLDEDFFSNVGKIRKAAKEEALDETFKKAEVSKGMRARGGKNITKKPFLKLGVILIFIAILALVVINFMPWMFIKYNAYCGSVQESYSLDAFRSDDGFFYNEIDYIFESPCTNCSNNSINFMGLIKDDFVTIPETTSCAFYALLILGIAFTIIEIFRKIRNLHGDIVTLVHSLFAVAACIVGVFVMSLYIRFLGAYFLLFYNKSFIEAAGINDLIIIFPATLVLILISFAIIMVTAAIMRINFHEFEKRLTSKRTRSALSNFKFGNAK